jgi:ABC-2 type transport system ATP-binding protein
MLSTHILPEVEMVCDRAIFISSGKIVAQGTLDELRNSRRMQARVLVECRGPGHEVEVALARVSGVHSVELANGQRDNYVTALLRPKEGYDIREEVARTVISNGWPLREVRLEQATLEEFFVQVTANQAVGRLTGASEIGGGQ